MIKECSQKLREKVEDMKREQLLEMKEKKREIKKIEKKGKKRNEERPNSKLKIKQNKTKKNKTDISSNTDCFDTTFPSLPSGSYVISTLLCFEYYFYTCNFISDFVWFDMRQRH